MKKGLMLLMLAACLITGCGNEKTAVKPEAEKAGKVQKTEVTVEPQETVAPEETPQPQETPKPKKTPKPVAENAGSGNVYDIETVKYNPSYKYRKITYVSELKKNIKMKTHKRKIIDIEKEDVKCEIPIYRYYACELDSMFKENVIGTFDWNCKMKLDNSKMKCSGSSYGVDFHADGKTCVVPSGFMFYYDESSFPYMRKDNMFAAVRLPIDGDSEHICIADIDKMQYYIVDFKDLIAKEFGVCNTNPKCEGWNGENGDDTYAANDTHMMFLDENRLVVRTNCNHVFVYDIKNEKLTDCIWLGENIERIYLKDGICNVTYERKDGIREFVAIDMDKKEIVANIKGDLGKGKFIYRKGVSYYLDGKGLYSYNCETKGFDAIYDKMADNTKYPKVKREYSDEGNMLNYQVLFEGDEIYLCRGIFSYGDVDTLWKELFYRKLTMK